METLLLSATKLFPKRSKRFYILGTGVIAVLIITSLSAFAFTRNGIRASVIEPPVEAMAMEEESAALRTVQPELVSGSSSILILGKVLSNETANIYPRRDGIVEDIYVDIGDRVKKNQVVALLLPKGVEGQSAAMIAEKGARKIQAETDFMSALSVADETKNTARQNIINKQTDLEIAKKEQESLLRKFDQAQSNVEQSLEQAFISVRNARQNIERILIGSNTRTGIVLDERNINEQLGLLQPENRYDLVFLFTQLQNLEEQYVSSDYPAQQELIATLVSTAQKALLKANDLLATTPSVAVMQPGLFTQSILTQHTTTVLNAQSGILTAKEKFEDARNTFRTLTSSEPALYAAWKSGSTNPNVQSNKVQMLSSQLQVAEQNLNLIDSQQNQMIEKTKSMIGVADAMLNAEYAQSGHRQILSPFSGTVSKRFIAVGQVVMPSMSAFELTDVPTSLAKKAKSEIQFGLPEYLIDALDVGDTVAFFLQTDETTPLSAEVTRKSSQIDTQTHTVIVQAKVPDELNLPNQTSIRIRLVDAKTPVFRLPSSAVKRSGEQNIVWVLDSSGDTPTKVSVSVKAQDGEFAEVTGSISEASQVILDPPDLFVATEETSDSSRSSVLP